MIKYTVPALLEEAIQKFHDQPALGFAGEEPLSYRQLDARINETARLLMHYGIGKGDKAAILSSNMPNWGVVFFATLRMGAVVVPILPDFHTNEIKTICINFS